MKTSATILGLAATAMAASNAAVTAAIKPDSAAPGGCNPSYNGKFEVTIVKVAPAKRNVVQKRDNLVLTLQDGILKDAKDRTGYIASNYQFQFDGPPQAGALYTAGFSACNNGSLALGGSTVFYQCLSGSFYNLYDRNWAAQCEPISIVAMPLDGKSNPPANGGGAGHSTVGTTQVVTTVVTALKDGQPQVVPTTIAVPLCQIGDGQVQGHTTPCDQVPKAPVTQISDGQPQGPTGVPVTQIGDGQPQAPSHIPVVSQISDGQPQAPTGKPVSQISDGQPQAPTGSPVTQISDGQPQAPTGKPVTQIPDGQPQAPTANATHVPVPGGVGKALPASVAGLVAAMGAVLYL